MSGNYQDRPRRRGRRWLIFLLLVVAAVAVFAYLSSGPRVQPGTVLVLELDREIPERSRDGLARFLGASGMDLVGLVHALELAAGDSRIRGLVVRVGSGPIAPGRVEELRECLEQFRGSGKFVLAHMTQPSTRAYLLATAADEVLLAPAGVVNATGVHASALFLGDLLQEIGVKADLVRVGRYKGAFEELARSEPTPAFDEAMNALVDSLYEVAMEGIARSRGLSASEVRELVDRCPMLPDEALDAKLVDEVVRIDELQDRLITEYEPGPVHFLHIEEYLEAVGLDSPLNRCLAVVHVVGPILDGESRVIPLVGVSCGADTVARAMKEAADSPEVAGILLRVDSPGGTVTASEKIFHAVQEARKKKPVVASMGDVAASGGYYAASGADRILAHPSTLTGSIGIFGGKFQCESLLQRHQVTARTYSRGKHAGMYDSTTGFTAEERVALEKVLEYHYRRFVSHVAQGRKKGFEEIEAVAQGRVWSGADALEVGLVDSLGGIASAVTALKDIARVSAPLPLRPYPPRPGFWDLFWKESTDELVLLEGGTAALLEKLREGLEGSGLFEPLRPMALLTFRWTVR